MRNRLLAAVLVLILALPALADAVDKDALTPTFWQRDPKAQFVDEGRTHSAPTSVSNGLIYLSQAFGLSDLVEGSGKRQQIDLIQELAEDMRVDPNEGGCSPDKVTTGLLAFVKARGYTFDRLEVATWRKLGDFNRRFRKGTKPKLEWMRKAAAAPDCVEVINTGWYRQDEGGYEREGGHWITVVGVGSGPNELRVHNPELEPADQREKKSITLTEIGHDFAVLDSEGEEKSMVGYYEVDGPGLPHGENLKAVVDCAIVFSLDR